MVHHPRHPSLYEINTRVFLNALGPGATLADIPGKYWKELRARGIDWVWLMGIWEIREKALDPHLIPPGMMEEFRTLIPGLTQDDICGSPYAIHDYRVDPDLGDAEQLSALRKKLHKLGMKLMLDFVPNHFGAHCRWLETHPQYFIEADEAAWLGDRKTYFRPWHDRNRFFAHGKDPYFDAWQDTLQVNYANPDTHPWMTSLLEDIASVCDGVRCDMAMLPVTRIFKQTWGQSMTVVQDQPEFWTDAIRHIKASFPGFLLLAECYWDMEAELLGMGFDYCYDKVFFDRQSTTDPAQMRLHFHAESWWLLRTARFLENHDEHRTAYRLDLRRHMAAASMVAFGPGMRFWHMGQWEGRRKKVPVQLNRYPPETSCGCLLQDPPYDLCCTCIHQYYSRLLQLAQEKIFREGEWRTVQGPDPDATPLCWLWTLQAEHVLVAINYSDRENDFSLADQMHLHYLQDPVDLLAGGRAVDPHTVHALAPWGIGMWKVRGVR